MKQHPLHAEIKALLEAGRANKQISDRLPVAAGTVAKIRHELGIPTWVRPTDSPTCKHGHPWPEHLGTDNRGYRLCRECKRTRQRPHKAPIVDELAIQRAINGTPPERLTPREREIAVLALRDKQLSGRQIARRIGCTDRTVWRIYARQNKQYGEAA